MGVQLMFNSFQDQCMFVTYSDLVNFGVRKLILLSGMLVFGLGAGESKSPSIYTCA